MANTNAEQLRRILARQVVVHRDLLALARARHLLLMQGRFQDAAELAVREAACIVTLRELETARSRLGRQAAQRRAPVRATRQIAALVRGLGAVERANRTLWSRQVPAVMLPIFATTAAPAHAHLN